MKKQNNKKKVAVIVLIIAALIAGIGTYAYTRHANNVPPEVVNGQKTISNYASNMKFSGGTFKLVVHNGFFLSASQHEISLRMRGWPCAAQCECI